MSRTLHDQTLALAGIFQAADLVTQIAHNGSCDATDLETCLRSLFATDPATTLDVYGGELRDLSLGLNTLIRVLSEQSKPTDIEILRYVLNLIQLESKLNSSSDMMSVLGSRIEQARHTASHFGYVHSNLISNLASVPTASAFKSAAPQPFCNGKKTPLKYERCCWPVFALRCYGGKLAGAAGS